MSYSIDQLSENVCQGIRNSFLWLEFWKAHSSRACTKRSSRERGVMLYILSQNSCVWHVWDLWKIYSRWKTIAKNIGVWVQFGNELIQFTILEQNQGVQSLTFQHGNSSLFSLSAFSVTLVTDTYSSTGDCTQIFSCWLSWPQLCGHESLCSQARESLQSLGHRTNPSLLFHPSV